MGFFKDVFNSGCVHLITATMRGGKTNLATCLIEEAIKLGFNIYTNILFFNYDEIEEAIKQGILKQKKDYYWRIPPEVHNVTKMSELVIELSKTWKNLIFLDEAQIFASAKKGVGKDIRMLEGFFTQIGKFDSAIALITQFSSRLGTMIKEDIPHYEFKVFKISFYNRYVEIWYNPPQSGINPEEPYKKSKWKNIIPSHYPYDHLAPAGFEIDLDIEVFVNRISKMNSLKVRKEIPIIVEEMLRSSVKQPRITVKDQIITEFYNNTNLTLKELAKKYRTSYQNVCNIHAQFLRENQESITN